VTRSRPVLLYDADCRVCRFVARTALRLDRRKELAVLPLQDEEAGGLLDELPPEERLASWRLVRPDGSLAGHGAGLSELLGSMWLTRAVGRAVSLVPDQALDTLYAQAARRRGRLGRLVPRGPAPRRYP
jgi:predicted DCC family thiol-disulfide oxidoreductase YuxK